MVTSIFSDAWLPWWKLSALVIVILWNVSDGSGIRNAGIFSGLTVALLIGFLILLPNSVFYQKMSSQQNMDSAFRVFRLFILDCFVIMKVYFPSRLACNLSRTITRASSKVLIITFGVELILITVLVGDQLARANPATYVYVWMERVCMAENPHQLCLYIWILTRNRTALPPDSACLHYIFIHVTGYHDRPPGYK